MLLLQKSKPLLSTCVRQLCSPSVTFSFQIPYEGGILCPPCSGKIDGGQGNDKFCRPVESRLFSRGNKESLKAVDQRIFLGKRT